MENLGVVKSSDWAAKRVLVTGHTGFKGSWLCQWLLMLGAKICGYSLEPPTQPNLFSLLHLDRDIDHRLGDIRDAAHLADVVADFRPEVVFHLAAQPLVRQSVLEPRRTYETNVMGSLNLYETVRTCESVRTVVAITTDKCYENHEWVWGYRETDPMGGNDPYSSSKGCAELLSAAYRKTFFSRTISGLDHPIALATARAGNVIGGGDWATDRLIPDCIRSLAEGKKIRIRNPNATRPWQHVLEPLGGYLILAQALESCGACFAEAWNFGPRDDEIHTVESLVRLLILYWGSGEYLVEPDADIHESQSLKLDISKARSRLRWRPLLNAKDAIERTIQWYRSYYACDGDIAEITRRQIEGYSRLAEDPQH